MALSLTFELASHTCDIWFTQGVAALSFTHQGMSALLHALVDGYHYLNEEIADPRTAHLPFLRKPLLVIAFLVFYNYFCQSLGPRLMEDRKPFKLKRVILLYDLTQVILSAGLFLKAMRLGWAGRYNWLCQPMEWEDTPLQREITFTIYEYFLLKLFDLLDTVFFVLRKKNSHVSFLHLYHHTGMVALTFGAAKWLPGGHDTLVGTINSLVHTVMYGYYFVTTLYPSYKRNIWWKKYITQMQMVQFFINIVHSAILLVQPSCTYPKFTVGLIVPQNLFMLFLFYDFYKRAYKNEDAKKVE